MPKVLGMNDARSSLARVLMAVLPLAIFPLAGCSSSPNVHPPIVPHRGDTAAEEYVVGGHVRGLEGIGLSLRNSQGDELKVDDDGKFVFGNRQKNWSEYEITIAREPISPAQTCTIERGEGRINGKNVMNVDVVCKTVSFEDPQAADTTVASR